MPGFVKTPGDEKVWTRAKKAAGVITKGGSDRSYATANMIFQKMKGKTERTERHGNPGMPKIAPQYPNGKGPTGAIYPFSKLEERWQGSHLDCQMHYAKYYDHGERRYLERVLPLYGGGEGRVVHKSSESALAKKGK